MNLRDADSGDILWEETNDLYVVYIFGLFTFPYLMFIFVPVPDPSLTKSMKVVVYSPAHIVKFISHPSFCPQLAFQRAS